MPKIEVYCTVSSCDYWGQGNHCFAEKILVVSDAAASDWPDSIDAPGAQMLPTTPVQHCMATACKTFRPRGSNRGPVQELLPHEAYLKGQGGAGGGGTGGTSGG
ncbi:MAG: DUF1540 domain-containing protein [Firmicutes bacterium]|nr:DUF1540 domain-containing protein [Bacillota bacterium]